MRQLRRRQIRHGQPEGDLPNDPRNFWTVPNYGLKTFASLFTPRQLVALTTFSDLVGEAREKVLADARAAGLPDDPTPLHAGGTGATAYADAMATYLAFAVSEASDRESSYLHLGRSPSMEALTKRRFARQAIPMTWDFAESNPFAGRLETSADAVDWVAEHFG